MTHPILLLYTHGGPDHRLTYLAVQMSLISIFLEQDLDFLCAVCTPPHNSWKTPVERVMSIVNLALQSVGLMRNRTESFENQLKNCNNLATIRQVGSKHPDLKREVIDAIEELSSKGCSSTLN